MLKVPFSIPPLPGRFRFADLLVLFLVLGVLSLIAWVASGWQQEMQPAVEISLHPSNIPFYAAQSLVRIFFAYALSLLFALWYGYTANRSKRHEAIMIPLLDVLQSIPVLSFLPGAVMAMIALFPNRQIGLELAAILLIFTGQVWNMAFSYYQSINTIPRELKEVSQVFRHSRLTRFLKLDLPFSAIGLIWNSMMSVAGGWFFLMACEMFVLKDRDFRLPGIGSYIQTAANAGDMVHVLYGIAAMVLLIIALDVLVWRPLVAWSQKFRFDTVQAEEERESLVLNALRKSSLADGVKRLFARTLGGAERAYVQAEHLVDGRTALLIRKALTAVLAAVVLGVLGWAVVRAVGLLSGLGLREYATVGLAALSSLARTTTAIMLAALWTVPLGVYIGLHPGASRLLQPLVQIAASVPATAVFPVILLVLIRLGGGLDIGAIFLMLLGTQWYILFNVIAGASAIPQDLREVARLYGIRGWRSWKTLILPGIFPYLITGLITATGGAWNATIVSEQVTFGGEVMTTRGLGSLISHATAAGDFGLLLLSTLTMAMIVVSINRLVWKRLFLLAQEKYRLD